ncbi:MAG: hydroxymethylbilane synthase [Pseudomonadota bacterium]|nr:hydroxymethylbilane synthase [Pseudomonadota bacterium]
MEIFSSPLRVVIATRESRLALWQAEHVKALLETRLGWQVELLGMTTQGDQILDRSLSKVGGKGLFVKELEVALSEGRADLAVHSLKDVPMDLPEGFALACVLEREDPRDAFVSNQFGSLSELPQGAVVGTSSLRRLVLLKALRPDLVIEPLRGNLDTRLRKLDEGQYAAIVLAAAGLKRLGLESRIRHTFEPADMLPAAGQGALGIEVRADRIDLIEALATLAHRPTWLAVTAERTVSRAMGGSCSMPLAAFVTSVSRADDALDAVGAAGASDVSGAAGVTATGSGDILQLSAAWGDPATAEAPSGAGVSAILPAPLVQVQQSALVNNFHDAEALGEAVAARLRAGGAVWAANAAA